MSSQPDAREGQAGPVGVAEHDGFRLIARRDGAGVRLITRNGHDWTERYPAVSNAVARLRWQSLPTSGRR